MCNWLQTGVDAWEQIVNAEPVRHLLYKRVFKGKPTSIIQDAFRQLTENKVALDFCADTTNPYIALFRGPTGTKFGVPLELVPPPVLETVRNLTHHVTEPGSPNSCLYSSLDVVTTRNVPEEILRAHIRNTLEFKGFKPFNCERETSKLIQPVVCNLLCDLLLLLITDRRVAEAEAVLKVLRLDGRTKGAASISNVVYRAFEPALTSGVFNELHQSSTPCVYSQDR